MTFIDQLPLMLMLYAFCGAVALGALYFCVFMTRAFWDIMRDWNKEEEEKKCPQVKK